MKYISKSIAMILLTGSALADSTFDEVMKSAPKDESYQNASKPMVPQPFPLPPRALKTTSVTNKAVILSWRPPFLSREISGYKVYRNFTPIATLSKNTRAYRDATVKAGDEYYYMVRALNNKDRESGVVGLFAYNGYKAANGAKNWEKVIKKPFVSGVTISFFWGDVEPEKGKFNWKHIDDLIALAAKYNKTVGLWPYMPSPWCPKWLRDKVKKYDTGKLRCRMNIPYPLDPVIKQEWKRFITELGRKYNKNPHIDYVLVGLSGTSAMHNNTLPAPRQFELLKEKFNYSVKEHIAAWKEMFELYEKVFPDQQWGYDIHFTNEEMGPAIAVAEWALEKYGSRVRVMNEGLNGNEWYRVQWKLNGWKLNNEYIADQNWRTMSGYQMLGNSWSINGCDTGRNGSMKIALENGIDFGANWLEIWTPDLMQKKYIKYFEKAAAQMGLVKVQVPLTGKHVENVEICNAALAGSTVNPGGELMLKIGLKINETLPPKAKIFIHVIKGLKICATADFIPAQMKAGKKLDFTRKVKIPESLAVGTYQIIFGISTGSRVMMSAPDGKSRNHFLIGFINVKNQ